MLTEYILCPELLLLSRDRDQFTVICQTEKETLLLSIRSSFQNDMSEESQDNGECPTQ